MLGTLPTAPAGLTHRVRRLGIDTGQEAVVYLRRDSAVVRSEGFDSQTRIEVRVGARSLRATLGVITGPLLEEGEAGLSEAAWARLQPQEGELVQFRHPRPLASLRHVRAKIHGQRLERSALAEIVQDIAQGEYSDIHIAAFLTACAGERLDRQETIDLTQTMVDVGERLTWSRDLVLDKHSVGGLPGNRTTPIIVPIVAAAGLLMPKTSSRAITSPAGTADTMETLAPVDLDAAAMRRVVAKEGACIVWGGAARLSPADDLLIRVERTLELDATGQLVASVLSKKAAAGVTHVLVDVPVGPRAKIRGLEAARRLELELREVGVAAGLRVRPVLTDGTQPVGRGIGPALEARDVLAVLQNDPDAPQDLRARALLLAGQLLELAAAAPAGSGEALARTILDDGRAWRKFMAICEAQGGLRTPPTAAHTQPVTAQRQGRVTAIDNRRLARVARLAGAPRDRAAGLMLHVRVGDMVPAGEPVFTIHAETAGELAYALAYAGSRPHIVNLEER
ncbi:MAG TPA: thymidine phosphorylase family protein [Gemmatimonadales bacterium]|nr:thymidine phosphorylase family protein [Gemmatimonadales bacterium]